VKRNITSRTHSLRDKSAHRLEREMHEIVAPWALVRDAFDGRTMVVDGIGRRLAFLEPHNLPNGSAAVDGGVAVWVPKSWEREVMRVLDRVAPYFVELHARRQEGRDLFDSARMAEA